MSHIPPTGALFAAFLGYNPVQMILAELPLSVTAAISPATLAHAFMPSLASTFIVGAIISLIAAALCSRGGEKYVHEIHTPVTAASNGETESKEVTGDKDNMNRARTEMREQR